MIIYQNAVGTLWYRDWYWHLRINEGVEVSVEQAEEFHLKAESLALPISPLLIDRHYSYSPQFQTLQLISRYYPGRVSAVAWVVHTRPSSVAAEVVKDTFLKDLPARIFKHQGDALAWLRQYAPRFQPIRHDAALPPGAGLLLTRPRISHPVAST
jgi:hypothetical protein